MSAIDPVAHLRELAETATRAADQLGDKIRAATAMTLETVRAGGTIFFCGNGGAAADAQHMATEYVVRYQRTRRPLRAIALTTDTSILTATGNDFSFDEIFGRQIEALGRAGDLLMVHSTSGNSPNCVRAIVAAKRVGMRSVALTAKDGGKVSGLADVCLVVPTSRTDRALEIHLAIQHGILRRGGCGGGGMGDVFSLKDKRAVVSGGLPGNGVAISRPLEESGDVVCVSNRSRPAAAGELVAELAPAGGLVVKHRGDLASTPGADSLIAEGEPDKCRLGDRGAMTAGSAARRLQGTALRRRESPCGLRLRGA